MRRAAIVALGLCIIAWAAVSPVPLPGRGEWGFYIFGDVQYDTDTEAQGIFQFYSTMITNAVANSAARKIQFAIFTGDESQLCTTEEPPAGSGVVNHWCVPDLNTWKAGADRLTAAGIPVITIPGNHDEFYSTPVNTAAYTSIVGGFLAPHRIGPACKPSPSCYVYAVRDSSWLDVAYSLTVNRRPLLVVGLNFQRTAANWAWMQTVEQQWLAANPNGAVWLLFHDVFQSFSTTVPAGANQILPWWKLERNEDPTGHRRPHRQYRQTVLPAAIRWTCHAHQRGLSRHLPQYVRGVPRDGGRARGRVCI